MISAVAKLMLVSTSLAPILVTWAFADWRNRGPHQLQAAVVAVAILMAVLSALLIKGATHQLAPITFSAASIQTADTEVLGFIVAYLLPLVSGVDDFDVFLLGFVALLVGLVVWNTNAYSVNPLLSILGYHFYEVCNEDGVNFLFISRRDLRKVNDVRTVKQLSRYVLLDGDQDA